MTFVNKLLDRPVIYEVVPPKLSYTADKIRGAYEG